MARIVETLDRHGVDYLLVGGASAQAHGAKRVTLDFDLVAADVEQNLFRLAGAMRELNARLHVEGLSDAESQTLPTRLDAKTLSRMEISTWRTDAGDLDVLRDIPSAGGVRRRYGDLLPRAEEVTVGQVRVRVASLDDVIALQGVGQPAEGPSGPARAVPAPGRQEGPDGHRHLDGCGGADRPRAAPRPFSRSS